MSRQEIIKRIELKHKINYNETFQAITDLASKQFLVGV